MNCASVLYIGHREVEDMREAAKRILSWIVILTVTGTFLSKNVFDAMALENIQAETSAAESAQSDFADGTLETGGDESGEKIEMEKPGEGESGKESTGAEKPGEGESGGEGIGEEKPGEGESGEESTGEEKPGEGESGEESSEEEKSDVEEPDAADSGLIDTDTENVSDEQIYILYIVHTLRYIKDGEDRYVQKLSQIPLTKTDFENGPYSIMEHAYGWEAVTASPGTGCAEYISIDDFEESEEGEKECWSEINYEVKEGWKVKFGQGGSSDGAALFSIYEGSFDNIEFEKAESITLTIYYKYSNTGGLAGIDAHAPDVIVLPVKEDGTADLENWRVPHYEDGNPEYHGHSHVNLRGFRTVLNPEPLNAFLVNPEAAKNPAADSNALENGDFNLREDVDITSAEYQAAWDAARKTTVEGIDFTYIAPTANGGTEATTSSETAKQYTLNASGLTKDLSLTIYYRRAMGNYKVRYWKAGAKSDGSDEMIKEVDMKGRIGALTNAKELTKPEDVAKVAGYSLEDIAQKTIAPDGNTVVDVYYSAGRIRVIFNTDYIYIPRQQVPVNGNVDFSGIDEAEMNGARAGYKFDGWQYEGKDGNRHDIVVTEQKLQLTSQFLEDANIKSSEETGDTRIQVLNLYPKWVEDTTTVRIVFWTEDLNGQDVKVTDVFHDFNAGKDQEPEDRAGHEKIGHERYDEEGASYTNVASFITSVSTGIPLVNESGELKDEIKAEIRGNLSRMGTTDIV